MHPEQPQERPGRQHIRLVVAGHTNTGKTSLLRTLGRTLDFGEVSSAMSTTRQVQALQLVNTEYLSLTAYDTPGLEAPWQVLDLLDREVAQGSRRQAMIRVIESHKGKDDGLDQEFRVLAQTLASDTALYVIDARDEPLPKYFDELHLLSMCGIPVVPLLNFTAYGSTCTEQWIQRLRENRYSAVVSFDAVVYSFAAECELYNTLKAVMPSAQESLDHLIAERGRDTEWRKAAALEAIADGLIDIVAGEEQATRGDPAAYAEASARLSGFTKERESRMLRDVLGAYHYSPDVLGSLTEMNYETGGWKQDPFAPETLKRYGVRSRNRIVAGAVTGGTFDVFSAGTTFGIGATLGAAAGAASGSRGFARQVRNRLLRNQDSVRVGKDVVALIVARNLALILDLEKRGHAAPGEVEVAAQAPGQLPAPAVPTALLWAEGRPEWSSYPDPAGDLRSQEHRGRRRQVSQIRAQLEKLLSPDPS